MELEGKVWKEGKEPGWLVEVPYLNVMTQGTSRKNALFMIEDAITLLLEDAFEGITFKVQISDYGDGLFGLSCNDDRLLLALALRRQREMNKVTVREAAKRLGSSSPNAYARYEQGRIRPTIQKYEQLLHAVNPRRRGLLIR